MSTRLACTVWVLALFAAGVYAREIHVGADAELRTIQLAVDVAQPGDTVIVHAGTYRETVTFPRSGTAGRPITLRAQGNAIVSGCDAIEGWTQHGKGIWKAPMPWTPGHGRNQAFDEAGVLIEARYPNEPAEGLGMYVSGLSPLWPTFGEFSIPKETMQKQPGRIVSKLLDGQPDDYWKGACYYGVHYEGWAAQTGIIESSKPGEINVGDRTNGWWFGPAFGGNYDHEEGRGMIVGHMNALDRLGEWHVQDGMLYLIPRKAGKPSGIEAKRRQLAFDLSGREHIAIEGINVIAASMRMDGSAFCSIDRCNFQYISHFTRMYGSGEIEHGRDTIRSGETGIFLGGHDNRITNCSIRFSAGSGINIRGYHHIIHNCLIDEVDYTSHYLNAITDAVGDFGAYENTLIGGHVITFNTMRNAGRHFFNFNGNGTSTSSRDRKPMDYMSTLFAHNHLYNGMLQTRDAGFITGYHTSGGTLNGLRAQVAYNVMHDSFDIAAMRWGVLGIVYLDNGSCDIELHHNLLWAAPGTLQRGFWFNPPCNNFKEWNNVFYPMFTRTSADLKAADFPEGKPFRFGHDFESPPAIVQWPPIEAKALSASLTGKSLSDLRDGDVISLGEVDFGLGWRTALARFSTDAKQINSDHSGRQIPRHRKATDPLVMEMEHNDGQHEKLRKQFDFLYNAVDGAWVRFNQVPLGEGYQRVRIVYGNQNPGARSVELRLDRVDGPVIARAALDVTDRPRKDRVQLYSEAFADVAQEAKGMHDVFVVFHSEDGRSAGEFEYLRFEGYRGQIALANNEVKIELRVGSKDGEKIGELYPRYTGGLDKPMDIVAKLEPVSGKRPLFGVVRSRMDRPVGQIAEFSLLRSTWDGGAIAGVGVAPRMDASGREIYPPQTNAPCARPAERYAQSASDRRPVVVAARLNQPPAIDGKLDEWRAGKAIAMKESPDGGPTGGAASSAWVDYDDEALYVAMRHPVTNSVGLATSAHRWGQSDGAEIAIQDPGIGGKAGPVVVLHGFPDGVFEASEDGGAPPDVVGRVQKAIAYKASVDAQAWTCEWRLPLSALGIAPKSSPKVLFNLGVLKASQKAWVILHGTGGPTYNVERGTTLIFPVQFLAGYAPPRGKILLWLDAADARTITKDAAGLVSVWSDKSGTGRDAKQTDATARPTWAAEGLGGKPSLIFDEKRRTRMEVPDFSDKKIDATIIAVISNPTAGSEANHDPRILTASDGKQYDYITGLCCSVPGMETGGPRQVVSVAKDRWAKQVHVGCFSPVVQTFLTGSIAEILVYERSLSARELEEIGEYLTAKWDLR